MKKLLRIAVVLCLAMALSVTAFATVNPNGSGSGAGPKPLAVDSNGNTVTTTVSEPSVTPTVADAAAVIKSDNVKAEDLSVVWVMDITAEIPAGGSVTITFEVPGATANDIVHVLHYNGTVWEEVAACKGNDIKAVFTSLSPVALVMEKGAAPAPSKPDDESPKTGEEPVLLVAVAVVLLAGAVAVVALKKKEEM